MVSRVAPLESREPYALKWWPQVDLSMDFVKHPNKSILQKYVLNVRHGKIGEQNTLQNLMGPSFQSNMDAATKAFRSE